MIKKNIRSSGSSIKTTFKKEGETIEQKVSRIVNNREPIRDGAPLIYTNREEGILPQFDVRTDRWDVALDAMDKDMKSKAAQREERMKAKQEKNGKAEPVQGTEPPKPAA